MDQKQLSQLDPKLRETYERVMGINAPQNIPPKPEAPLLPSQPEPNTPPPPQNPQSPPIPNTPNTSRVTSAFVAGETKISNPPPTETKPAEMKRSERKISPVVVVLGIAVFFIIYTFVWIKVFDLKIPLLPSS